MDRRVRRTREALADALVAITREFGWDAATVSAIATRADVSRTTFYEHFDDRNHLLREIVDVMLHNFGLHDADELDIEGLAAHVIEGAPHLENFLTIPQFRTTVVDAMVAAAPASVASTRVRFAAGGLLAIAQQVAVSGERPPATTIADLMTAALYGSTQAGVGR